MYTINFFKLEKMKELPNNYIEDKMIDELNYELHLSTLDDVKSFLSSKFYENVYYHIFEFSADGIVITDKDDKIIYKELFNNEYLFSMYTNEKEETIYTKVGNIKYDNYVIIDKFNISVNGLKPSVVLFSRS